MPLLTQQNLLQDGLHCKHRCRVKVQKGLNLAKRNESHSFLLCSNHIPSRKQQSWPNSQNHLPSYYAHNPFYHTHTHTILNITEETRSQEHRVGSACTSRSSPG